MLIIDKLTCKDYRQACHHAYDIIDESHESYKWYPYFDQFAELLYHPKSYVRNRAFFIIAANARWDDENKLADIMDSFLKNLNHPDPITVRQCIKALKEIGYEKPEYISVIKEGFNTISYDSYKDSMVPLIKRMLSRQ